MKRAHYVMQIAISISLQIMYYEKINVLRSKHSSIVQGTVWK